MGTKKQLFNIAADYSPHFMNQEANLAFHEGESRPQQTAQRFDEMFQDIQETSDKFVQHLFDVSRTVLGEKRLKAALKEIAITPDTPQALQDAINSYELDQLIPFISASYQSKIEDLKDSYVMAEAVLDDWVEQHKDTERIYSFPAFQDFYLQHPLNTTNEPLAKDHGNDDRYAIEGPLCRICLKSPYSAFSKLFSDYKSPETPETPFKKELLTDIQRARITCPDQKIYEYIKIASHHNPSSALRANSADNMGAILEDNRLVAPKKMTGHRVFFQKFALPTDSTDRGSVVELQILPQSILDSNDITHILMDKADDLLNVPAPSLSARIHANFLYNMCSFIHRRCAEYGGFQRLVGEGLDPNETIHKMMLDDQRAEVYSAAFGVENKVEDILLSIRNGDDYSDETEELLEQVEQAVHKSVTNWSRSKIQIYDLFRQIDARIELISGDDTKKSAKDLREASILCDVQRLIYDQAQDTNIFTNLRLPRNASDDTDNLMELMQADPDLALSVQNLVQATEAQTTSVILGHSPSAAPLIAHSLGIVNQELIKVAPDKRALSQALNKSASNPSQSGSSLNNDTYGNLLNRKRNIEFYSNALSKNKDPNANNYIGVQRDIFGNINMAVQFKNDELIRLDMQTLKDKFAHSYERVGHSHEDVPSDIRKKIGQKIFRFSQIDKRQDEGPTHNEFKIV